MIHDSRQALYRLPGGALRCKESVTLRLRVEGGQPERVLLRLWWQGAEKRVPMAPMKSNDALYECSLNLPDQPGLMWYFFIVEAGKRRYYYGNADDRLGGEGRAYDHEPPSYQLTVYDRAYETPGWMRSGVMYQIMADRFHASKPLAERTKPEGGWLHADWNEPPTLCVEGHSGDNRADDLFGGDLEGIRQKLPYLQDLGVTVLYLNPIFRARSNHKYDTGDYMQIDPSFGDDDDFRALCESAERMGIRVMLDGVFSHTGSDSRYFNRYGRYGAGGAYRSRRSKYRSWYNFCHWPDDYDCWWGFDTLPNVNEMDPGYLHFMIEGEDAVAAHWLNAGASGWRLDVADELPMDFLRKLRARVKDAPDAALLGEVWEDASNKCAYGEMRSYCLGDSLDSVMNYPLRDGLIAFMTGELGAKAFKRRMDALIENYPPAFAYSAMNLLGSHDRPRIINALSGQKDRPRNERTAEQLSPEAYALGKRRFLAAWRFMCALPGMPSMYYGDEAGAQGMGDPFCRGTYPWGREDQSLLHEIQTAIRQRRTHPALRTGRFALIAPEDDVLIAVRWVGAEGDAFGNPLPGERMLCALNRSGDERRATIMKSDAFGAVDGPLEVLIPPLSAVTMAF